MAENSERIRVTGIAHRDKDDDGRLRFFFEGERDNGTQFKGFVAGNENLTKWCGPGKTFYGDIREDQGMKDSKGNLWARVWRDWDKNSKGEPRQTDRPAGGGNGSGASSGTPLPLDAAAATYDALSKTYGAAKGALLFQKLDIYVPYSQPAEEAAPSGFTPAADEEIPF